MSTDVQKGALLTEIQNSISSINNVWPLLDKANPIEFKKRQKLLSEKRKLLDQYDDVLDDLMNDMPNEITCAINDLKAATEKAKDAKKSIQEGLDKIEKLDAVINQAVKAVVSVAQVLA